MDATDILRDHIYPNLDVMSLVPELSPKYKGGYYRSICPECETENLKISKEGTFMKCFKNCYSEPIWNYILNNQANGSGAKTLEILAKNAKVNLNGLDSSSGPRQKEMGENERKSRLKELNEVRYEAFDSNKLILK